MNEQFRSLVSLGDITKDGLAQSLKPNQPDMLLFSTYSGLLDGIAKLRIEFATCAAPADLVDAGMHWTSFLYDLHQQALAWPQRLRDAASTMDGDVATVDLSIRANAQPAVDIIEARIQRLQKALKRQSR